MIDEQALERMVNDGVAKCEAEYKAAQLVPPLTREQQLEARLNEAEFRERIGEYALLLGVQPSAIRHVVRDAELVFEMRDGALIPRNGATDPSDPLSPLTPARWLQELAKTDAYLFAGPSERTH